MKSLHIVWASSILYELLTKLSIEGEKI